jgi:Trk K+ transport system NAD-binding subunit
MKIFPSVFLSQLGGRASQRNLKGLVKFLLGLSMLVVVYSVIFHFIMAWEGRSYSWLTGFYWTLTVMSTLGFGDITFHSDLGRLFSIVVLLSGTLFMLILLPFTFIEFFYVPWMEAQSAAMAPRELRPGVKGHVVLLAHGPIEMALIRQLQFRRHPYVVLVPDVAEALRLNDLGLEVMVGERDDPDTYRRLRLQDAELLATTGTDMVNTNVAFTARSVASDTIIVATSESPASVDILKLAGSNRVLQLAEMMGQGLARRVTGRDAKSHVIGQFGELLIAEAGAVGTPMVGRTLREIRLPDHANVNVIGVWERGEFRSAGPNTKILSSTVLILAGTRLQLDHYDGLFCIYNTRDKPVVIIGGGRVGSACAHALASEQVDYRIIDLAHHPGFDPDKFVQGDAADLQVLEKAGLFESPAVVVTTHDDDMNVYLTLYCRKLRPDIQIISRSTLDRNIDTLHRAGADFVMSYASLGANAIYNLLRREDVLLLAEGLSALEINIPPSLAGQTLGEAAIRESTGCNVIAVGTPDGMLVNPPPDTRLPLGGRLIVIGSADGEEQFLQKFGNDQ